MADTLRYPLCDRHQNRRQLERRLAVPIGNRSLLRRTRNSAKTAGYTTHRWMNDRWQYRSDHRHQSLRVVSLNSTEADRIAPYNFATKSSSDFRRDSLHRHSSRQMSTQAQEMQSI